MKALFVAWRAGEHSGWGPVGRLDYDGQVYRFCYVQGARTLPGFRPFPGMDDLEKVYESVELFPLFANRLLAKGRRREYEDFLRWGNFNPQHPPDPIAILGVTEGIRQTDAIEVFPCPAPDAEGCFYHKFFLHGVRWMESDSLDRIGRLTENEVLELLPEPENAVDTFAVSVVTTDGKKIGYVPRYFARDAHRLLRDCHPDFIELYVECVNLDAPLQHRVLCRMHACWPNGFVPCRGKEYLPIPNSVGVCR